MKKDETKIDHTQQSEQYNSGGKVFELNERFPTTCLILQQVRRGHADWYYDIPEGYIRYYKGASSHLYEQRLVAESCFGKIPDGYVVQHLNQIRSDNRAINLQIISRAQNALLAFGREPMEMRICPCGKQFKVNRQRIGRSISGDTFCSKECLQFAQRKTKRPSSEELEQLMREVNNWGALGEMFGVSDNAVRKWAKQYGLDLTICNGRRKAVSPEK